MQDQGRALCQNTYHHAFTTAEKALAAAERRDQVLDLVDRGLRWVEHVLEETLNEGGGTIACRKGCSLCCRHLRIDARAHEVFLIVRHLRRTRFPEELESLRAAAQASKTQTLPMSYEERKKAAIPCVLLNGDLCGLHAVRPAACRRYFSMWYPACEAFAAEPTPKREAAIEYPLIAELGRYAANGLHNAFIKAGYDGYHYDLNAALAEALADETCELRWAARLQAFSDEALSKTPEGFDQTKALADLKTQLFRK